MFSCLHCINCNNRADIQAFNRRGRVPDGEPVDIHRMKSRLGAPDFTSGRGEAGNGKDAFHDSETEV